MKNLTVNCDRTSWFGALLITLFALPFCVAISQNTGKEELLIKNLSATDSLKTEVIPVGFIFAGDSTYRPTSLYNNSYHLFGGNKYLNRNLPGTEFRNCRFYLNHDVQYPFNTCDASIGYGLYKVRLSKIDTNGTNLLDSLLIDYSDSDYPYPSASGFQNDFEVRYFSEDSIYISFADDSLINLKLTNREFEIWNQISSNHIKDQNRIGFKSNAGFTGYPYSGLSFGIDTHLSSGDIRVCLDLRNSIRSLDTLINLPTEMKVVTGAKLNLSPNILLEFVTPAIIGTGQYNNFTIQDSGFLTLTSGAKIIISSPNQLKLEEGSIVTMAKTSVILFRNGSTFCNEGGRIFGGNIVFEKGNVAVCATVNDFVASDSCSIILQDSITLSLPDDYTLYLKGNETALVLNPGSKLLFGVNSGIVCDSGARIIANDATFASVDSTKKWNGISLNDPSHDTIKNCTIKNAMYGIALSGKYDPDESPEPYSSEISGCSFINQTSYVLNNALYLDNSAHVLVKDNTVSSTNLSIGFTHGIYAEYCPDEMLNFISNNISNCNNGMTVIQSSPYIAFNTLNGNSYGESGMFLDSSNGTIKYNVISDFYNSYYSFYSSPDLLKNTFDNSCEDNVYLSSSSVPVMHPLVSNGSTYWFAGDNHITGSSYDAGILFDEDAYPDMNYGYNRITLTGSNYYLSGVNPSASGREFYVYENYWGEVPPDSLMFNITGADVKFNPYDNNSQSVRQTNAYDTNDIGFGFKDTVHILQSDNPNSAQELFLLAYQSEFNSDYDEAIGYNKEIVSEYKDSSNASSCLARIFNCYDKKQATITEYALLENYFLAIAADTSHSVIMRNISEDLAIQSNIKQGNIEEAISNYDEIYANNTNTPKGFHALINKEILAAGSGDNLSSGNTFDEIEFKQIKINTLLKVLNGRDANANISTNSIPLNFNLSQNYPNPFNPSTKISYELRVADYIVLRVFDALGKEVVTLVNEVKNAGRHEVEFKAGNLPSGVYFYTLSSNGSQISVKRMALVK